MDLSTRQLRAFCALADTLSFTRAATACHLSQPAFSALVRQLESQLGLRLFDRSTRHVALTPDGAAFEPAARRVLAELDGALAGAKSRAARETGRVTVALLPSLAAGWLPQVLAAFRARHAGIDVQVADVLSEACVEAVRGGQADFALAATRADTPELRAEPFCADDFHLVCPRGHALAKLADPRPRDVAAWPFIHLSRTSSVRACLEAATHPHPLPGMLEVEQLATVAGMVRAGLGVSIVPALTLYQFRDAALRLKPLHWPGLARRIYLVRRRDRSLSAAAEGLSDWLRAHRPETTAPPRGRALRAPRT